MVEVGDAQISTLELTITGIALLLLIGLQAMLRRTRLGLAMRAIAQDGRVAGLMGIDTNRVVALAFGVGAAVGGVGRRADGHLLQLGRHRHGLLGRASRGSARW